MNDKNLKIRLLIFTANIFLIFFQCTQDAKLAIAKMKATSSKASLSEIQKEAEEGNSHAQYTLARMYQNGEGVDSDNKKAIEWYTKAVEQGNANALYNLGTMYQYGEGVPQDIIKAVELITRAAGQGFAWAQYNLGEFYQNGVGVPIDKKKALEWYAKAAENENARAQFTLGLIYENREHYDEKISDVSEKATEKGYVVDRHSFRWIHEKGDGVPEDKKQALEFYRKAAEEGYETAQFYLGWMYFIGIGTEKNEKEAFKWWSKAREQGNKKAKKNIDLLCRTNASVCLTDTALKVADAKPSQLTVGVSTAPAVVVSSPTDKIYTDLLTGMELVFIPAGCFLMGDTMGNGNASEKPMHEVCVEAFYIGKFEVTQGEYQKIMGINPSSFKKGERYPVESVSWNATNDFIKILNSKSGQNYRLPTEAEWEYAARANSSLEKYSGSNDIALVAWYSGNSGGSTHPVGQKKPNGFGLYDMSGKVQ
jgi:TPR repeat protein